jgi:medium-chain acyl-[acyl-carrier-protein] hydrolase
MTMNSKNNTNPWLPALPAEGDEIRLFCLPYAGAGASVYRGWSRLFAENTGVYPIQFPGRENRIEEPPFSTMEELVDRLSSAIRPCLNRPFAFFGHSIGARIAFELTRNLRKQWNLRPQHLIVSGSRAPHIPEPKPLHHLSDDEFVEELRRFSGTPEEVLRNRELMEMFIPVLRADFSVDETYLHAQDEPLDCPITAFGGTKDREANRQELEAWAIHTRAGFGFEMIEGDHFFLHSQRDALVRSVSRILSRHMPESGSESFRREGQTDVAAGAHKGI